MKTRQRKRRKYKYITVCGKRMRVPCSYDPKKAKFFVTEEPLPNVIMPSSQFLFQSAAG